MSNFQTPVFGPSYDMELVYPPGIYYAETETTTMSAREDTWEQGLTTAQIIAAQSQDYVDEKLAEYQATIYHLQGTMSYTIQSIGLSHLF